MSEELTSADGASSLSPGLAQAIEDELWTVPSAKNRAVVISQMIEEMVGVVYWSGGVRSLDRADAELASLRTLLAAARDHRVRMSSRSTTSP